MPEKYTGAEFTPNVNNSQPIYSQGGPSSQMMGGEQQVYAVQTTQTLQNVYPVQPNFIQIQEQNKGLPSLPQSPQSPQFPPSSQNPQIQQIPQTPPPGYVQPQQPIYEQAQYGAQPGITYVPYQPQVAPQQVHVITHMGNVPRGALQINTPFPVTVNCPHCNNEIVTIVTEAPGSTAYLLAAILCCVFWPLMWLPCVISGCLDKTHSCPVCRNVLAHVKA
ncbi:7476_t:CDS:1 [Funneliformis geosporum]|uniref:9544_t:CDS:1 n=1 Tax=Funneliformis geosporum TaxID=1117311 RepID=A0A9W4T2Z5_9GLOM|nr:9544_t:CDS:1 [Funneliformis geosporum]CAI2191186.1 7476_t:CDS:1 [Funneliformis geosporum]